MARKSIISEPEPTISTITAEPRYTAVGAAGPQTNMTMCIPAILHITQAAITIDAKL